ncbi:hypothetical protein ABTZ93_44515 [Streptomyces sp. NPDC097941]|uniref:hypothetical protein n=1 Tax=Streptomyces sp. NPDC097941 TaxID=3155685 RepID=UPI00331C41F5
MALKIEPMRSVGGSMRNGTDDLFTVMESLQMFADGIGVERRHSRSAALLHSAATSGDAVAFPAVSVCCTPECRR